VTFGSFGSTLWLRTDGMACFEDLAEGEILSGNVVGGLTIGTAALIVIPLAAPLLRPIAKTAIKGGILAYKRRQVAL